MLQYTICFIKKNQDLLLLNRRKAPTMGLWNGVGGKLEKNESPSECVIRETFEETGIELDHVTYAGNALFNSERGKSGMYIFIADFPERHVLSTPLDTIEGILDWKPIDWILDEDNQGVVGNLKKYLPELLRGNYYQEHQFVYENHCMQSYTRSPIVEDDVNEWLVTTELDHVGKKKSAKLS